MKTKFAIGCLVQWYEIEIVGEYIESLKQSLKHQGDKNIIVNFTFNVNQMLEKVDESLITLDELTEKFKVMVNTLCDDSYTCDVNWRINEDFITIADYRRWFLDEYCTKVDVLIQGETDALIPKQTFTVLDMLHQQVKDTTPKYLATFGINKMWDDSWKPLEHVDFTDKPFIHDDEDNWWSIRYTMNIDEMNKFNDKVEDLDIVNVKPHKFNGCGFVISSDAVKSGVNIPRGTFFIDDTALGHMAQKVLPDIPQYHFRNILIVHNRKHPKKRSWILGENDVNYIDDKRKSTDWYTIANEFCKINDANIFNPNFKFYTWDDVWKKNKRYKMKSLKEIYQNYKQSDNVGHGDKGTIHSYIKKYEMLFSKFRNMPINILEIGIAYGESLSMWQEYFLPGSFIYGIDNQDREFQKNRLTDNMIVIFGDATKPDILKQLSLLENPTFDIIIDDGSHRIIDQIASFNIFKSKMNPGGIYVIEDVGHMDKEGVEEQYKSLDNFDEFYIGDNIQTKSDDVLAVYKF